MISDQLLFLFSALGAVNAFFLALYLFSRRSHGLANLMLGGLLLAIGIRTGKSVFYYFNDNLALEFVQLGLSACLLIGPLTYLYVCFHLADLTQASPPRWHWHLLFSFLVIGVGILLPYSRYPFYWHGSLRVIHAYWFAYLLVAGWRLWQARKWLGSGEGGISRSRFLLLSVYFSSGLILLAYLSTPFTSYIVGAISFTFSIFITGICFLLHREEKIETAKKEKYQDRKLTEEDANAIVASLNQIMLEQQLHLNPNLSLTILAKKVGHLQTTVSQVLNETLSKSFNLYVNEFRIAHAKELLLTEMHLNMELVAVRSGFNSNSTFFAAFKKIVGQTPASFRATSTLSSPTR